MHFLFSIALIKDTILDIIYFLLLLLFLQFLLFLFFLQIALSNKHLILTKPKLSIESLLFLLVSSFMFNLPLLHNSFHFGNILGLLGLLPMSFTFFYLFALLGCFYLLVNFIVLEN